MGLTSCGKDKAAKKDFGFWVTFMKKILTFSRFFTWTKPYEVLQNGGRGRKSLSSRSALENHPLKSWLNSLEKIS